MVGTFPLLLTLLLCCGSLYKSIAEDAEPNPRFKELLNDLDSNDLSILFDHLNLEELIRIACSKTSNPKINAFIGEVFLLKYNDYTVYFGDASIRYRHGGDPNIIIDKSRKRIHISDLELAASVLEVFENSIKKIEIDTDYTIKILENQQNPLNAIVDLSIMVAEDGENILPLSYLFNKLRSLTIKLYADKDLDFLDCVYPHLEHLEIGVFNFACNRRGQIENIIKNNPKINALKLEGDISTYIKSVSEWVPKLESLQIQAVHIFHEAVQFDHVKHFTCQGKHQNPCFIFSYY